eukprot:TRINITY_DN80608_c0_g1_i1.p1 TRINITY_DN80608_c0_g1~~TRINITY_DN80608_c0_g1_i1.p1  ORF type:complete len:137 (+),score=16.85 TRINITY_DN80608_c0_g1_i1:113-523(+)
MSSPSPGLRHSDGTVIAPQLDCWAGEYTFDVCCNLLKGPWGNEKCWSGIYAFQTCCLRTSVGSAIVEEVQEWRRGTAKVPFLDESRWRSCLVNFVIPKAPCHTYHYIALQSSGMKDAVVSGVLGDMCCLRDAMNTH